MTGHVRHTSGRRPKPDHLKILEGNTRYVNKDAPQAGVDDLQFIPDELSDLGKKHWGKIRPLLVEAGIAINTDKASLIVLCEAWATYLDAIAGLRKTGLLIRGANGHPVRSPYLAAVNESTQHITRLLIEFGMTPAARTRVASTGRKPKRGGMFDDL